jgi:uncharacterized repeat protein (TIGR03806 family)
MTLVKSIAFCVLTAASFSHAAEIVYLGGDTNSQTNWRTASFNKPAAFDPDGDNVYGDDGYYAVKATIGANPGVDSSLPAYVSAITNNGSTFCSASYPSWDSPTLPVGASVTDRRYGLIFGSFTPLNFTLAAARKFVLTIPVGGNLATHYPTSLSVVQTAGGSASASATNLPVLQNPVQVSYLFFQIEGAAGDRFQININGGDIANLSIGGLAWETISPSVAGAGLVNRWSFNEAAGSAAGGAIFADSIAGQPAVVVGVGATKSGTALTLPGSGSQTQTTARFAPNAIAAYVDLPNGIISSKTDFTIETWSTSVTAQSQTRLFDFGRMNIAGIGTGAAPGEITNNSTTAPGVTSASDDICFIPNRATNISTQQLEGKLNGAATITGPTALPATIGTEYHDAFVYEDGIGSFGDQGGLVSWYRNGAFVASINLNFHLRDIEDVNNWLGRSQWTGDLNANIAYNEVRLHSRPLSAADLAASYLAGPNVSFPAPLAQADSATINPLNKVRLEVLANDSGNINPATVAIQSPPAFGTATPAADGKILYTHTGGTASADSFTYVVNGAGGQSAPATVTIQLTSSLRVPSLPLNVPDSPPPTTYQIQDAFGALPFADPVCLATPPGETGRLFVCQKAGLLRMIPNVTAASPTASTFLDLPTLLAGRNEAINTGSEQGLLGLAFHPNFASNRHFYVFYSVDKNTAAASPGFQRVSRFTVQAGNPNLADPASELILIEQEDQAGNHNGGDLHFGPDGYLYVSLGDEGNQDDSFNNSQRIAKDFFSAILRIDVDKKPGNLEPNNHPNPALSDPATNAVKRYETAPGSGVFRAAYSIPIDNPFVTVAQGGAWNGSFNGTATSSANLPYVRSEFWAVGLRNPWRMSFDTGSPQQELWVGDVGGSVREEVTIATKGGNYGWNFREGFIARPGSPTPPAGFSAIPPVYDYTHNGGGGDPNFEGNSITGGFVYRGARFSNLVGAYIFADHVSGHIWTLRRNGVNPPTVQRITGESSIAAFGKDPSNGDVLMANIGSDRIRRLVGGTPDGSYPVKLSETRLFADLTDLSPSPGLLPYKVNLPFWSDHAVKSRFFTIPDNNSKMTWSREGPWTYPTGQIWVKHFDMPLVRSDPPQASDPQAPAKRIETRLLVKTATGSYGVSYRWNEAGTEATLAPEEGENFDIPITRNGSAYNQRWRIPSRAECMTCHTPQGGHSLSMNTRQLNLSNTINGSGGNQLDLLKNAGYFSNSPESPNLLPRHLAPDDTSQAAEARVRSYLAVNCAYCHQPGGTGTPAAWDGRSEITLGQMGIINGAAVNNGGNPLNKLVVPGNLARSVIHSRVAVSPGFTRMPPLGSTELDQKNIALLSEWINGPLASRRDYDAWRLEEFLSSVSPQGAPGFDADGDGMNNYAEYLTDTDPNSGSSFLQANHSLVNGVWSMQFPTTPNRFMQVETSQNLTNWTLWDVPGNGEIPRNGAPATISGPSTQDDHRFFRIRMREN